MTILQRCAALTGAAYVVLANVGNALSTDAGPRPNPTQSPGQQVLAYLHWLAGSPSGEFGVTLELLAFAALMLFVGYLCTRVRAGGWLRHLVRHLWSLHRVRTPPTSSADPTNGPETMNVTVFGATGGIAQLVVAELLTEGTRSPPTSSELTPRLQLPPDSFDAG